MRKFVERACFYTIDRHFEFTLTVTNTTLTRFTNKPGPALSCS